MTLAEFWDECERHDWYNEMSDDHNVWKRGQANMARIRGIARVGGKEYEDMLDGFTKHMYSGKPWKTERSPKPERPKP